MSWRMFLGIEKLGLHGEVGPTQINATTVTFTKTSTLQMDGWKEG